MNGRYRVYVDPFQTTDSNGNELIQLDTKVLHQWMQEFSTPYVPLQMVRGIDSVVSNQKSLQNTIWNCFKSIREGATVGDGETPVALGAVQLEHQTYITEKYRFKT